MPKFQHLQ